MNKPISPSIGGEAKRNIRATEQARPRQLVKSRNYNKLGGIKMPRIKAVEPNALVKAWISPELKGKLYLHLTSEVEARIPLGKISEFIGDRIREFFGWQTLDLTPYGFPAGFFVKGPESMIRSLQDKLALAVQRPGHGG